MCIVVYILCQQANPYICFYPCTLCMYMNCTSPVTLFNNIIFTSVNFFSQHTLTTKYRDGQVREKIGEKVNFFRINISVGPHTQEDISLLFRTMMIPYFISAHHPKYANYGLNYLRSLATMPTEILEKFIRGEHVTRHTTGIWNGVWTDMMIEATFMR